MKPPEERLREAALRRKQQVAQYLAKRQADKRAKHKIAKQRRERQLREIGNAYAYQPEVRQPVFGIFSNFR